MLIFNQRTYIFNIQFRKVHILDGNAPNLEEECINYERKMKDFGGVHLFLGGIGTDGHMAFNEPGSSLVKLIYLRPDQQNKS